MTRVNSNENSRVFNPSRYNSGKLRTASSEIGRNYFASLKSKCVLSRPQGDFGKTQNAKIGKTGKSNFVTKKSKNAELPSHAQALTFGKTHTRSQKHVIAPPKYGFADAQISNKPQFFDRQKSGQYTCKPGSMSTGLVNPRRHPVLNDYNFRDQKVYYAENHVTDQNASRDYRAPRMIQPRRRIRHSHRTLGPSKNQLANQGRGHHRKTAKLGKYREKRPTTRYPTAFQNLQKSDSGSLGPARRIENQQFFSNYQFDFRKQNTFGALYNATPTDRFARVNSDSIFKRVQTQKWSKSKDKPMARNWFVTSDDSYRLDNGSGKHHTRQNRATVNIGNCVSRMFASRPNGYL